MKTFPLITNLVLCCALTASAFAQTAAPAPAATTPAVATKPSDSETIELSPFEVRAENDVGYQAANTTSGSRLNSRLKDTPASISAFTAEFLSDIAATNLEEMLAHATNVEIDVEDSNAGFNNPQGRGADGNDYTFRMRGSPGGSSRDYVESSVPVDLYNVEHVDVASGPNSILFGLGSAGGLVSLSGKKAMLNRDRTTLKSVFGTWHYERYEGDYNKVIIPKKVALRLIGLYQNNQGWRYWDFNDQVRYTGALTLQPLKNTTIYVSGEKGHTDNNLTMGWNASDAISAWNAAGRPVADGAAVPGTSRFGTANRFTFNDNERVVYNLANELQSTSVFGSIATLVPPTQSPYEYSLMGPGGVRHQTFHTATLQVQQKLPKGVIVELAYFYNTTDVEANGLAVSAGGQDLRGDPNLTLPRIDAPTVTVPNPHARELFFETQWFKDQIKTSNEIMRLTTAWEVGNSRRWFGRHRLAGLLEHSSQDRLRRWRNEILVDENNVPISNANNAEAAANQLTRRHYTAEGDFKNYYSSDSSIPMPEFTFGGRRVHSTYASRARANTQTEKSINTTMFASQSFWLKDRFVTTFGVRKDDITFVNAQENRILDRNDPRVTSGRFAFAEWDFDGTFTTRKYSPSTFSAGGVLHATRRISLFYNTSRNSGAPRFDRTVAPTGDVGPPTEGRSRDGGIMIDVLGDDRLFIRTTWFQTVQLNDTPILPGANALGVDNLATMLNALLQAGKISQADYDRQAVTWTTTTIDVNTSGMEVEVVANPTKSLTLRASYSNSKRRRENFFTEIFTFFNAKIPEWRSLLKDNPTQLATFEQSVTDLYSELDFQVDRQNTPFGSRPHKMNGTARYSFREGTLRGAAVGATIRYQGKNFMSWDRATGHIYWGNESVFGDAFVTYRTRVPRMKIPLTLQLNVKNITNSYLVNVGRLNDNYTGIRRVYLNEPRSYRFTTTVEF
jgi:outer membrane receptor protein involved in Fe transport